MLSRGVLVALALSVGTLAGTAQNGPPGKTPEPPGKTPEKNFWDELKDPQVRAAKAKYDAAQEKARREYEAKVAEARKTLLADLKTAEVTATKDGNLDRALEVRKAKTAADDLSPAPAAAKEAPALKPGAFALKGSQYRIFLGYVPWDEARARCKKLGGDLAVLDTAEKRAFIAREIADMNVTVGAYRDAQGQWRWVNGKAVAPDVWAPGRPDAKYGPRAHLFPTGLLGDGTEGKPHESVRGYVCEWPLR
jgi:hypothetical protein